ncbi:MAG: hypothetical protein E6976_01905, partial [Staphylococcus epidermidis]|nr:hypothetical protein [Staphylococcus epidermidis]
HHNNEFYCCVNETIDILSILSFPDGYNLRGSSNHPYAQQEVAGAESLYGNPRDFILKHNK